MLNQDSPGKVRTRRTPCVELEAQEEEAECLGDGAGELWRGHSEGVHPGQKQGGSGKKYWPSLPPGSPDGFPFGQPNRKPANKVQSTRAKEVGEWIRGGKEAKGAYSEETEGVAWRGYKLLSALQ